jgi:hypothetical protein
MTKKRKMDEDEDEDEDEDDGDFGEDKDIMIGKELARHNGVDVVCKMRDLTRDGMLSFLIRNGFVQKCDKLDVTVDMCDGSSIALPVGKDAPSHHYASGSIGKVKRRIEEAKGFKQDKMKLFYKEENGDGDGDGAGSGTGTTSIAAPLADDFELQTDTALILVVQENVVYTWDTTTDLTCYFYSITDVLIPCSLLVDASTVRLARKIHCNNAHHEEDGHHHLLRALPVIRCPSAPSEDVVAISMRITDESTQTRDEHSKFTAKVGLVCMGSVSAQEQSRVMASVHLDMWGDTKSSVMTMHVDWRGKRMAFWSDGTRSGIEYDPLEHVSYPMQWAVISASSPCKVEIVDQPDLTTN